MFFPDAREHLFTHELKNFTYKLKNDESNTPALLPNIFSHICIRDQSLTIPGMLQIKTSLRHRYALITASLHLNPPQ